MKVVFCKLLGMVFFVHGEFVLPSLVDNQSPLAYDNAG